MSATNDTPLKRFTAFWFVLGAFLLFGIIALILAPLSRMPEVTEADEANAVRRLAIKEQVEAEQVKHLERVETEDKVQVPPKEIFSMVASKLVSSKPEAMKTELFRDPATVEAEKPAEEGEAKEGEAKEGEAKEVKPKRVKPKRAKPKEAKEGAKEG